MAGMASEFELIGAIERATREAGKRAKGVVVGIGDDAAVLRASVGEDIVITADSLVEGRHFERTWLSPRDIGWKLAAANLSDIAAMGASPRWALLSFVLPKSVSDLYAQAIAQGAAEHLARYGAAVVGGNITSTDGPLSCDMTLVGACRRGRAWQRKARSGDAIVVVGTLGASMAGISTLERGERNASLVRAFRRPVPQVDVARALARVSGIHGAIDISDGLSSDLIHMCEASKLGCELDASALPIARAARAFCVAKHKDPVEWALHAGEDYALLLSVDAKRATAICRIIRNAGAPVAVVGCFTSSRGVYGILEKGQVRAFEARGWDHLKR